MPTGCCYHASLVRRGVAWAIVEISAVLRRPCSHSLQRPRVFALHFFGKPQDSELLGTTKAWLSPLIPWSSALREDVFKSHLSPQQLPGSDVRCRMCRILLPVSLYPVLRGSRSRESPDKHSRGRLAIRGPDSVPFKGSVSVPLKGSIGVVSPMSTRRGF